MNRRDLIKKSLMSSVSILTFSKVARAEELFCAPNSLTPKQTKGPFYPKVNQVDTDADLIVLAGRSEVAKGEVVIIEGVLTDQHCAPVAGALVEIWQACASGKYNHASDPNTAPLDPNFQYWGKAVTDRNGFYRFRTIIPGAYPADTGWDRPPHVHFKVSRLGYIELITQMYFKGEALNEQDLILKDLSQADQDKVVVDFKNKEAEAHPVGQFNIQIRKIGAR